MHEAFFDWYDDGREDVPFFAYLHFMDVHNPYRPPRFLRQQFVDVKGRDLFVNGTPQPNIEPTDDDLQYMTGLYDAEIRFVDLVLENLINDLQERNGLSDTVVIVTSDHGDEFMDHGGFGHGMSLEMEMLHIPMIMFGPGVATRREADLVRQLDLAPTITDLAGLPTQPHFAGTSLLPAVIEQPARKPEIANSFAWVGAHRSLTTPEWHLTLDLQDGAVQLYDLHKDLGGLQESCG